MKQKHLFTLPELVLVVVMLFAGATMVVSAVTGQTAAEKNTACQNNLKKFSLAMILYSADNNDWLLFPGLSWNEPQGLGEYMGSYISNQKPSKNPAAFACPADERPMPELQEGGSKFWSQTPEGKWAFYRVSYAVNLIVTGMPNNLYWKPHQVKEMRTPSQCFFFSDSTLRDNPGDIKRFAFRHELKANVAFADGSVRGIDQAPKWESSRQQGFWVGGAE